MKAGWVDLNNNVDFWKLEWFNESQVPKSLLSFSRNVPWIQERLLKVCTKDLHNALLGGAVELTLDQPTESNLEYLIWSARAKLEAGDTLDTNWLNRLESAAESNPFLHIEAASLNVKASQSREMLSRQRLCSMDIPFVYPGDVLPLHIELFAGGEKALHVLHVELLRKLGMVIIDSLEIDCQHRGAWLLPLIEVLPERKFIKKIQKLTKSPSRKNQRLFKGGGWGLLATYAQRIGLDVDPILERGNEMDWLYWTVTSEMIKHTAVRD